MRRFRLPLAFLVLALPWRAPLAQPVTDTQSCVDVKIGSEQYYNCLNRHLQETTRGQPFTARSAAPYSAASPAPEVNSFSQAASKEQLGTSFGHSAIPQRPPKPVFFSPLTHTAH